MANAEQLQFSGQVAIISGAARGLGREYALLLASRGASIVVNDLGGGRDGSGKSAAADSVVQEIVQLGGKAIADYNSVEEGHKIVQTAIDHFGRIDILINNAGILRDKSMMKITEEDWDLVHRVHLRGAFLITKAAWPYFRQQNYGRIIMTSSPSGIYGNFGQANYSSAKLGMLSLAKTLAVEGQKYNIKCNTIVPVAASRLTEDLLPEDLLKLFMPRYVAPIVAYLCHETCPSNGDVFEAAGGFFGQYRWQRSNGKVFFDPNSVTIEDIRDSWSEVTNMKDYSSPTSMQDHTFKLISQLRNEDTSEEREGQSTEQPKKVSPTDHLVSTYSTQDVILYALSVGVSTSEQSHLSFLYEADDKFAVLPTFATSFSLNAVYETSLFQEAMAKYNLEDNLIRTLHGEQYLKIYQPIPTSGKLISKPKIIDVLDKGSGALILIEVPTYDQRGELIFYNQLSLFMIGSGNFGGKRTSDNANVVLGVEAPRRPPDAIVSQQTTPDQAATFRLCGDRNPLHIDPSFSIIGGFDRPILHGLCMLGFAVRHALRQFADYDAELFDATKARFVGTIIPGQTIETRLWRAANGDLTRIHFECFVKETGSQIISSAFVDLKLPPPAAAPSCPASVRLSPSAPQSATTTRDTMPSPMAPLALNSQNETVEQCKIDAIFGDGKLREKIRQNPQVIQLIDTVYQLNISKNGKPISQWTLDLKNGAGDIYRGTIEKGKPGCTLIVDDDVLVNIFTGKADALQAFMSGQLKVSGNILAAQKLQQIFSDNLLKESENHQGTSETTAAAMVLNEEEDKALLDSVPISGLKSDLVFTLLRNRMHEEPDFIRRIRASYQFNITLNGKFEATWTAENKTEVNGCCYNGPYKNGKADCIVTVEDEDFIKLMFGKLNPQRAFMLGKLKVKGNIMLLQRLNSLWLELLKSGKAPEFPYIMDLMSKTDLISGLRSEVMIIELVQRLIRLPYLCTEVATLIGFEIVKDGKVAAQYILDFTKNKETGIFNRGLPQGAQYCVLTLSDEDFTRLTNHKFTLEQGIEMGKIKVRGDQSIPAKISIIFKTPTSRVKL